MKIVLLMFGFVVMLTGCTSVATSNAEKQKVDVITIKKEFTPHLWSSHKVLNYSAEICSDKAEQILSSLGFTNVRKSKHGEYVYGNYITNRAAVKCVPLDESTFVYAAVAGSKVKVVERLRNEIIWKF